MSMIIDSGDSYLDRNRDLFLSKLDLKTYRRWRAYSRSLTKLRCEVEIDGTHYWLMMNVSAGSSGFVRFKKIDPTWHSWPAQQRYAERAERLLPDRVFAAKENLIHDRIMDLPLGERQKLYIHCDLVRYDNNDNHYRAHAHDCDGNEIHVTELGSFHSAQRMLREWAVVNNLHYGGGYTRHDNPAQFQSSISAREQWRRRFTSNKEEQTQTTSAAPC